MLNFYDYLFGVFIFVTGYIWFSVLIIFLQGIGTRKNPARYRKEKDGTYTVYKWVNYRIGGAYETYKFRQDGDKLMYIGKKSLFLFLPSVYKILYCKRFLRKKLERMNGRYK